MRNDTYEYAIIEWLWDVGSIELILPNGENQKMQGAYPEIISLLNDLGKNGWDIATSVASNNWIVWTLKRQN